MGVARMKYVNVCGPEHMLQRTLGAIARLGSFAPEQSEAIHSAIRKGTNHYEPLLNKAKGLLKDLGHSSLAADYVGDEGKYVLSDAADFLEKFAGEVAERSKRKNELESQIEVYVKTEELLGHMTDVDISVDELFKVQTMKVRVGRLPKNSYVRLKYYSEKGFNFTSYFNFMVYDFDGEYYWGIYFAPNDSAQEIDDIFSSLYFERTWLPEFVHGKPEEALGGIHKKTEGLKAELATMTTVMGLASQDELLEIQDMTAWLAYLNQLYDMKKYALAFNHTFYITGFVPEGEYKNFETTIEEIPNVEIQRAHRKQEVPARPPVKLNNGWFSRPYAMFTEMYGLPSYKDIDPTGVVAVIYSVLYGLMFADFGQGLVLGLFGYFYMYKKRGMGIGHILARASFFSCIFGILFGSFFGNEEIIGELWHKLGVPGSPIHVMSNEGVNMILIVSVIIGATVTLLAIFIGILSKFRRGVRGEAFTSANGIAGFVFYISVLIFAADMLFLKIGVSKSTPFIIVCLVLPVVIMLFQEPIAEMINGHKVGVKSFVGAIGTGFFEVLVIMIEYLANTVSFLRVGGFVLAHAGIMSVVLTLANMSSGVGYWLIMVVGNVFAICLEGLLVGIQALRLNYYELFSRFYEADGIAFEPLTIHSDVVEL